ncbi:MAG: hypothetical protein AB7C90_04340 [Bacteroidales bacterium]
MLIFNYNTWKYFTINYANITEVIKPRYIARGKIYEVKVIQTGGNLIFHFFTPEDAWRNYLQISDGLKTYKRKMEHKPVMPG